MKLRTHTRRLTRPIDVPEDAPAGRAGAHPGELAATARVCGVLLLVAGLAAGLAHLATRAAGRAGNAAALAAPRDPILVEGIRFQVALMRERGIVADVLDGSPGGRPTVVVVTDRYLCDGSLEAELPLYGGHFVGFADDYAWLVNGHHDVRLVREDGTEIGRRTGHMSDAQVQEIYRQNRRGMHERASRNGQRLTGPG